ncbi:MAG: hypothetical protein KGZ40_08430 [Clostridiales bacterium]|nr:hypothetical protein [Clostridiales bacterium]
MDDRVLPPVLVVMLDGLGDRPWAELGGLTPLAAAHTPNLDAIAAAGTTGILHPLGRGRAPGTELAHFVLLGYDELAFPGRAVLEATSAGIPISPGQVCAHAILVTVRRNPDDTLTIVERYPEGGLEHAAELFAAIETFEHEGVSVTLRHTCGEQAIVLLGGEASEEITDTDPHNDGWLAGSVHPLRGARDPRRAALTARALTAFLRHAYTAMRGMTGTAPGDETSPFLLIKWTARGAAFPTFAEQTGMRGCVISASGVLEGLSLALGMAHRMVPLGSDIAADTRARLAEAADAFATGAHFVLAHTKAPDEAGHAKNPSLKRDVIAAIDAGLEGLATRRGFPAGTIVVVTGDHGTPSGTSLIHSGDPVPLAVISDAAQRDSVAAFDELACAAGSLGHVRGTDFMPMLLNWRGTVRYSGGLLATHTGVHWPDDYEPFTVESNGPGS